MSDIVLMSPPSRMVNHYRPPLALMYVAEWYRSNGLRAKIIDIPMKTVVRNKSFWRNLPKNLSRIKEEMLNQIEGTKTIGISCYSTEVEEVKDLVREIRKITPARITVGGVGPTLFPEDFMGWTDTIVRGRLDVGFPAYDLVNMKYYSNANPYAIRGVYLRATYVLSSLACPSQCKFCVAPKLREHYKLGYIKTPLQLAGEVRKLQCDYDLDGFYIIDDLFTLDKAYVKEFSQIIKYYGLLWGCSSRVNTIDESTIIDMALAGCIQMDFGVERGSDEELKRLKKGQTVSQIKDTFSLCNKYKIRTFANFLVGLPGETEKERTDIERLVRTISPTVSSFNLFEPYKGTELYAEGNRLINQSLRGWINTKTRQYNSIWKNAAFAFRQDYWKILLKNPRKINYFKQLWNLIAELVNQIAL